LASLQEQFWALVGKEYAPIPQLLDGMYHASDFGFAMLLSLVAPQIETTASSNAISTFKEFP
jgi:hypothetical protein